MEVDMTVVVANMEATVMAHQDHMAMARHLTEAAVMVAHRGDEEEIGEEIGEEVTVEEVTAEEVTAEVTMTAAGEGVVLVVVARTAGTHQDLATDTL
jgi:hypothetical protein